MAPDNIAAQKPAVSVVMPLHNSASTVEQSVLSICNQSFQALELIVIDDGSEDDGLSVVTEIAKSDQRIRWIKRISNDGPAAARNAGLSMARGRYVAFCDSDDIWLPEKLAHQLAALSCGSAAMCCSAYYRVGADGQRKKKISPPLTIDYSMMLRSNHVCMSTAVIDTKQYNRVELPNIPKRQDYALWLALFGQGLTGIGLAEPLVEYRIRPRSVSSNKLLAAWYHWVVLRQCANLSRLNALQLFCHYAVAGITKRI